VNIRVPPGPVLAAMLTLAVLLGSFSAWLLNVPVVTILLGAAVAIGLIVAFARRI
jgi:hypothetical protein